NTSHDVKNPPGISLGGSCTARIENCRLRFAQTRAHVPLQQQQQVVVFVLSVIVMAESLYRSQPLASMEAVCPIAVYLKPYVQGAFMSNTAVSSASASLSAHQAYDYSLVDVFAER